MWAAKKGFTLSELLIALSLVGVIATFTVPKVLTGATASQHKAVVQEAVAQIQAAYTAYKLDDNATQYTNMNDLSPYINYVSVQTSGTIDHQQGSTSLSCSAANVCLKLHNGAVIRYTTGGSSAFSGTDETNAIDLFVDPDGVYSGTTNGDGKAVELFLYYDGVIRTRGDSRPNTVANGTTFATPNTGVMPPWFSWN